MTPDEKHMNCVFKTCEQEFYQYRKDGTCQQLNCSEGHGYVELGQNANGGGTCKPCKSICPEIDGFKLDDKDCFWKLGMEKAQCNYEQSESYQTIWTTSVGTAAVAGTTLFMMLSPEIFTIYAISSTAIGTVYLTVEGWHKVYDDVKEKSWYSTDYAPKNESTINRQ